MAGTNEFAFFHCRSMCTGGGGPESGRKKFKNCLPAGTGTKIYFSLREAKPGGFQTRVFPTFFGKGPDCVADPFGTVPRRCS